MEDDDQINDHIRRDAYHLVSLDSPHLILTQLQLKEHNYDEWVKAMRLALRAKKKTRVCGRLDSKTEIKHYRRRGMVDHQHNGGFVDFKHH